MELQEKTTKLKFKYLDELKDSNCRLIDKSVLTENYARVYIIVVDGEIKKIGGSQAVGGIKATLQIYQDGGIKGRPSIRSYGVWFYLYTEAIAGKKIEFYMIYQDNFQAQVKGLFGFHAVNNAYISYKLIEECCLLDYKSLSNDKIPDWNLQEQGLDWSNEVKVNHAEIMTNSATNSPRNKKTN